MMSMALAAMTLSAIAPAGATQPGAPVEDRFDTSTGPAPQAPTRGPIHGHVSSVRINNPAPADSVRVPNVRVSKDSTPREWFTAMDAYVGAYRPTKKQRYNMREDFGQEVEKVTLFCKTVSEVAHRYRLLAQKLKSLPIPDTLPDPAEVKEYRDLLANWYNSSAAVYEDMIRPRPPARTKEELQRMIQELKDRSEGLKENLALLQEMDSNIRLKCHVDPPKYDDAIGDYTGPAGYAGKR